MVSSYNNKTLQHFYDLKYLMGMLEIYSEGEKIVYFQVWLLWWGGLPI